MQNLRRKLRRWLRGFWYDWSPFQRCKVCGKWHWAGFPSREWTPGWSDYCSRECADEEMEHLDQYTRYH